jgi:hypothetical protein
VHLGAAFIRKRSISGSYPGLVLRFTNGGTLKDYHITVNPETGAFVTTGDVAGGDVVDYDADWWFVWVAGANNSSGNTNCELHPVPAVHITLTAAFNGTAVGTTHFWGARIQLNTSTPFTTDPWLRAGDLIQVVGPPVILDVAADVTAFIGDPVAIPIHPPIFTGQSPADDAAVVIDPTGMYFNAVLALVDDFPDVDAATGFLDAGLTLHWREQPI